MGSFSARLERWIYKLNNWEAHLRARLLGDSNTNGVLTFRGELAATILRWDGSVVDLGVISRRVVTTAGVNFIRDDFNGGTTDISNMNFHDSGTGVTAEAIGDVDLQTVAGPTTRATGTPSGAVAKQYKTIGTISYSGPLAITEHGLFSSATRGSGTLLDRSVFAAINVVSGDSIQFQYTLTINDGG